MKTIQLRPKNLRNESIIIIQFPYEKVLINCIKKTETIRWSQSLSSWYIKKQDFNLNRVFNVFKSITNVDYSALKTINNSVCCLEKAEKTTIESLCFKRPDNGIVIISILSCGWVPKPIPGAIRSSFRTLKVPKFIFSAL
jgi:hypothetical protein